MLKLTTILKRLVRKPASEVICLADLADKRGRDYRGVANWDAYQIVQRPNWEAPRK